MFAEVWNSSLHYLVTNGLSLSVQNYISLDTMGDASTLDELGPETRGEIERLVEAGFLVDVKGRVN